MVAWWWLIVALVIGVVIGLQIGATLTQYAKRQGWVVVTDRGRKELDL